MTPTEATPVRPDAARVAAIRARVEAATAGPWEVTRHGGDPQHIVGYTGDTKSGFVAQTLHGNDLANALLIAHAPADLAWLLARVERLESECGAMLDELQEVDDALRWTRDEFHASEGTHNDTPSNHIAFLRYGHDRWTEYMSRCARCGEPSEVEDPTQGPLCGTCNDAIDAARGA